MRNRWLDLRRDEDAAQHPHCAAKLVSIIRAEMEAEGFVDIETPIMGKPTPEGARDFLVPTRLQPGTVLRAAAEPADLQAAARDLRVRALLPDRPICFRDEDLRADRLQEITQLDVEMAFPDQEFLFGLIERIMRRIWRELRGVELEIAVPAAHVGGGRPAASARDKPDLRFGLEIEDATEVTRGSEFKVFADAPAVRFLRVPRELSRGDLAKLEEVAKQWGAKGLAYLVYGEDGEVRSPIAKFLCEAELERFGSERGGHTVVFGADEPGHGVARARRAAPPAAAASSA